MIDRNRLRRLRILQRLAQVAPAPMGEVALLIYLRGDPELQPTVELVRQSIVYLVECGLASAITVPSSEWTAARITAPGRVWLETPGDHGYDIYSPAEKPEPNAERRGKTSSIELLPPEVKAWVDQALTARDKTYQQLVDILGAQGYRISKSAMGRYGKDFREDQKRLKQSVEMAKAFAKVVGDDGAALNQTLTALAQQEAMEIIRAGRYNDDVELPKLMSAIASLSRSDIATKKFQIEEAARKKALEEAAARVDAATKARGLGPADAKFWRETVLMGL